MLIQFSVENYLSIKDKVVLSLLSSRDNEHPEHLIADGNKNYLKSAVIYGANASGKSNVLNAFWFSCIKLELRQSDPCPGVVCLLSNHHEEFRGGCLWN